MSSTQSETISRFEAHQSEWDRIAETREFKDLMATKKVPEPAVILAAGAVGVLLHGRVG